jgi:hypothetical protein
MTKGVGAAGQACLSTFSPVPGAGEDCTGREVVACLFALEWAAGPCVGAVVGCDTTCGDETGDTLMTWSLCWSI